MLWKKTAHTSFERRNPCEFWSLSLTHVFKLQWCQKITDNQEYDCQVSFQLIRAIELDPSVVFVVLLEEREQTVISMITVCSLFGGVKANRVIFSKHCRVCTSGCRNTLLKHMPHRSYEVTLNAAFSWVHTSKSAKCEVDWIYSCGENPRTVTDIQRLLSC